MNDATIRRNARTVFRRLESDAGGVLLHLDSGEYRQLNQSGALIWSLLEPGLTRAQLLAELRRAITDPPAGLESEVDAFLEALQQRGLVETDAGQGDGTGPADDPVAS